MYSTQNLRDYFIEKCEETLRIEQREGPRVTTKIIIDNLNTDGDFIYKNNLETFNYIQNQKSKIVNNSVLNLNNKCDLINKAKNYIKKIKLIKQNNRISIDYLETKSNKNMIEKSPIKRITHRYTLSQELISNHVVRPSALDMCTKNKLRSEVKPTAFQKNEEIKKNFKLLFIQKQIKNKRIDGTDFLSSQSIEHLIRNNDNHKNSGTNSNTIYPIKKITQSILSENINMTLNMNKTAYNTLSVSEIQKPAVKKSNFFSLSGVSSSGTYTINKTKTLIFNTDKIVNPIHLKNNNMKKSSRNDSIPILLKGISNKSNNSPEKKLKNTYL